MNLKKVKDLNFKKITEKYSKNPKKFTANMIILLLCGVLLILIGDITNNLTSNKAKNNVQKNSIEVNTNTGLASTVASYEEKIKRDLVDTLSQISGVGKVSVMIYFDGGSQSIPAMNISDSNKKTEEKDNQGGNRVTTEVSKNQNVVIVSDGGDNKPFIVKQVNPSIGGVMVVAEGATNSEIKEKIQIAVKTVLNVPAYKVSVLPMKK